MYFDGSTEFLSDSDQPWNAVDDRPTAGRIRTGGHELLRARAAIICRSRIKRLMDVVGAALLLTVFSPLMLAIVVLIRLEGGGPVLFRQQRYGLGRSEFTVLKFRSMRVSEPGHSFRQAARQDARITRLGALLRRTSLDELPQLINVLRGEMSLVGPVRMLSAWMMFLAESSRITHIVIGFGPVSQVGRRSKVFGVRPTRWPRSSPDCATIEPIYGAARHGLI